MGDALAAFGLAIAAALGLDREYPERMPITANLNGTDLAVRDQLADACTNDILVGGAILSLVDVADLAVGLALLESHSAQSVLDANSVALIPKVPDAPVHEWHAATDPLIPVYAIEATAKRYCNAGVSAHSEIASSPDHLSAAVIELPGALKF